MQIYLVGGAVRDELLGLEVVDRDFVIVGASPQMLLDKGYRQVGKDFPVFLHPQTQEEYALARTERKAGKGYTGFTCYAAPDVTLEDDLQRRDLTINAIAKSSDDKLVDPYGGIEDLHRRVLRHVSPAFSEDPLRILRVARFAARFHEFGFRIAAETWHLMQYMVASGELTELSRERVWQELSRCLTGPAPHVFCQLISDLDAWSQLLLDPKQAEGLNPIDWRLLMDAASQPHEPATLPSRYALFALCVLRANPKLTTGQLQQALRVPNDCAEVSTLLFRIEHLLKAPTLLADDVINMLKLADPIRRPQRWQDAMRACRVVALNPPARDRLADAVPHTHVLEQLILAEQAYCAVSAEEFMDAGLSGAQIGQQLAQKRFKSVNEALQQQGSAPAQTD
ncbi:MAG: hypothetical protein JJU03_12985 [Idiomarina sp.]|nr:hypothetical protein [Idiomarina sp.]